jgi:putative OPT family oligopeptide transporter
MAFHPYIPAEKKIAEFTLKSVLAGVVFGIIFGAANAYLGLRVGLTISTSIPIAVLSVAFFRFSKVLLGGSTILENNMAQTVGSASSSMASGLIFTIPALFMWGLSPSLLQITLLAVCGSLLGIFAMIPLRQFLIVNEHENLPYPEGTACAEVLKAADAGGQQAHHVFTGLGIGALYKAALSFFKLWPETIKSVVPFIPKAELAVESSPALLGVGYIIGLRLGLVMVAGGLISSVILIPLLGAYGNTTLSFLLPDPTMVLSTMKASDIWSKCIRYVGAGAVTFGGFVAVVKAIPTMRSAFMAGVKALTQGQESNRNISRTEQDLPMWFVLVGIVVIMLIVAFVPQVLGSSEYPIGMPLRLLSALCVGIFAFLFVTVSSRVVGLVGVSSNPTSAMTIVSLLGTATLFYLIGSTDLMGKAAALTIGTIVCVAASKAGDISQDLKAGYIVGATPRRQQQGQLIGAICASFFVASAVYLLGKTYTFGSTEIPAPQANLMKTIIEAVMTAKLPWGLTLLGAGLAAIAHFAFRVPALPFAIGLYIPLSTNAAVCVGGALRHLVEKRFFGSKKAPDNDPGGLLAAGLIAGEGILGVIIAIYAFVMKAKPKGVGLELGSPLGEIVSALAFALVAMVIFKVVKSNASALEKSR